MDELVQSKNKNRWKQKQKRQKVSVKDRLGPISYDDGPSFYDDDSPETTYQPENQQRPSGGIKDRLGIKNLPSVSNPHQRVIFDDRSLAGHSEFIVSESQRQSGGIKNRLGYAKIQPPPPLPSSDTDLRLLIANRDNNGNIKARLQLNSLGQRSNSSVKERISQPTNNNVPKLNEIYGNVAPYGNYLHMNW